MNGTANPHWIGPRRGSYVTVVIAFDRFHEHARVMSGVVVAPYRVRLSDPDFRAFESSPIDPYGEGMTWCFGWQGEEVDALKAAAALR